MAETWTIKRLLEWTELYLKKFGIDRARLETEMLLAASLGVDRLWLYTHYDQPLVESELAEFRGSVIRRSKKEPLQYILGKWNFWSLEFIVSTQVHIPRQETEHLVELALELADAGDSILDLCTGCGNIVISLAKELPSAHYLATDISFEAIKLAGENAKRNNIHNIHFILGDLLEPFQRKKGGFDIIVCNPPYIPTQTIEMLQAEIKDFEPKIALNGGTDGLDFYRRLIPDAVNFINDQGQIIMEIGSDQAKIIKELLLNMGYHDIVIRKDYSNFDRVVAARYSKK